MSHLFKKFRRDIAGLIWLAGGVFIGLALFSHSPNDPSLNSIGRGMVAHNYCGYFGSFLADIIYLLFGLTGWILVFGALRTAWRHFRGGEVALTRVRLGIG